GAGKAVWNRELRVSSFVLTILVLSGLDLGAACSSGGASSDGSATTLPISGDTTSAPSTTIPEGYAKIASLLLTNVPRGLPLQPDKFADTGATNLDKATQHAITANAGDVLRRAGFVVGYQRSWAAKDQAQQDVLFLYEFAS